MSEQTILNINSESTNHFEDFCASRRTELIQHRGLERPLCLHFIIGSYSTAGTELLYLDIMIQNRRNRINRRNIEYTGGEMNYCAEL